MIATDRTSEPRLAFDDERAGSCPLPRWPDPDFPQQVHLDFPVFDLGAADKLAVSLGARRLQDQGEYRTYADPAAHPFCLYRDGSDRRGGDRPLVGEIGRVVLDCWSPRLLAAFYAELLDRPDRPIDTPDRVVVARSGRLPAPAFQHATSPPPRWPDPAHPQQIHLDIWAENSQAAQEAAVRLGAIPLPGQGGEAAPSSQTPPGIRSAFVPKGNSAHAEPRRRKLVEARVGAVACVRCRMVMADTGVPGSIPGVGAGRSLLSW